MKSNSLVMFAGTDSAADRGALGIKRDRCMECAPDGGQFHAAVLTVCRAW
jgi:hypothetical protein